MDERSKGQGQESFSFREWVKSSESGHEMDQVITY